MIKKISETKVHFCSHCEIEMFHYEEDIEWEENRNIKQTLLRCLICDTPNTSWINLKENK